jgi:PAS domain S-box-containing protein
VATDIRILHVEDDAAFAELTATFLQRENDAFSISTAADAEEALDRLDAELFDCILSDYNMPGKNGIEFLEAVRERDPDIPFILFTGKGSEAVASDAISAGVTDYLQKRSGSEQYELLANRIASAVGQYRAERELERKNDLFAKAQDLAHVGAWEYDITTESHHTTAEVLRIHGLSVDEELPPERAIEYYHPEDQPTIRDAFEQAIEEGESYDLELRLLGDDGERRWVRTRGEPQFKGGDIVRLRGTLQDITEQKQREMDLERQNARLEEFAHVVSHDIRNPLQVASGALERAEQTGDEETFQQIRRAHDRIDAIIEDILVLSRQRQEIERTESVDLSDLARDAWETTDTSSITLSTVGDCEIRADRDRLRQLFENLFRNAVEHTTGEVTVTVGPIEPFPTSTRSGGRHPTGFYVSDDGDGIPPESREDVFEPGFTTADSGIGFGLAIVEQIAESHGWEVSVEEGHRGGARFEFVHYV